MNKTAFRPRTDGFAFVNSWTFDPPERKQMVGVLRRSTRDMSNVVSDTLAGWVDTLIGPAVSRWAKKATPETFGLCGGMAAAALDYFNAGRPLPRGKSLGDLPTYQTPEGAELRRYLLRRQLETMGDNFPKLLVWMGILHVDLPFIEGDGPRWLRDRSLDEWGELKARIDAGTPWPMMLIGSSVSPFNNHQVLAYGYDDPDDGTGTIFIYDMNCPDNENTIRLDFRGEILQAEESCPSTPRGPLRGFFCNNYDPAPPPELTF